jgi:multidrug resistance efflux pump
VAGAGIVEAQTENISVGSPVAGVVTRVHVKVGQRVKLNQLLFELDDRQMAADLKYRQATLEAAQAQLLRLKRMPREEEKPSSAAKVAEAKANLADQEDQYQRARSLYERRAIAEGELITRKQAFLMAQEQLRRAEADYKLLLAGAWKPDILIAKANVAQAEAQVAQTKTELDRLKIRVLLPQGVKEAEVLQVNVRPGEFVGAPPGQALIVLGTVQTKHVRVDIDEHDIPRFRKGAPARAQVRGNPGKEYPLTFVRVEPYVIPKKSLTGDNTERVDTRVLQVIYALDRGSDEVYVGQQMDVFIDGKPVKK